jgi:N-methylhydantoinase B
VALASYPLYILIEGLNEAIANAMPEARPAGYDMVVTLFMWGLDESEQVWIDSVNITGGAPAAAPYGDGGGPLMPIACSGVRGVSWEVFEAKTPMTIESTEYAVDSHGVGKHRGGPGWTVVLRADRDMELTIVNERSKVPPFALAGGEKGRRNEVLVHRPDGSSEEYSKVTGTKLPAGSRIEMKLSGGAGVGPAAERPAEKVKADIAEGYLSEERAREKYPHAFQG